MSSLYEMSDKGLVSFEKSVKFLVESKDKDNLLLAIDFEKYNRGWPVFGDIDET